jgi:predicted unusual protein kinase regulating ubiquinone biosynthesis (AarF/ABC1/UbiB family)
MKRLDRRRYLRILVFFAQVLMSLVVWEIIFPHIGLKGWSRRTRINRLRRVAAQFRQLAISMGGVLIKVGQFLSSRVDILPEEFTSELSGLQDEVPAEHFEAICRVAEAELGAPLREKFLAFDELPWAAASLGQVHLATLDGEVPRAVVVKVQRPEIEEIIATDLQALRTVGGWVNYYPPIRKRVDIPALLHEFTRILLEEIDYLAEGRNAETFATNFAGDPVIRIPQVIWTHTTRRVLTLEDVRAIKITDFTAIEAAGISRSEVANRLLDIYLKQIFVDGFFHADPHPGNLFVTPCHYDYERDSDDKTQWQLTFVDFGMVGRVQPMMKQGMREMLMAIGLRDASRLVKSYQMMGILLPGADLKMLEDAEEEAFRRFWGKSMQELRQIDIHEISEFAFQFRKLIYTLPVQIPQDLILLARSIGILSGMCTGLDPQFNVWVGIVPFAQELIAEEAALSPQKLLESLGDIARKALNYPRRIEHLLGMMEHGELVVRDPHLTVEVRRLEAALQRATGAVVFATLLLAGVQVNRAGFTDISYVLLGGAGIALIWTVFRRSR